MSSAAQRRPGGASISVHPKAGLMSGIRRAPSQAGVALVYAYRWTLGLFVPEGTCKYHPSCSQYAIDALRKHGLVKGSAMTCWRLLRCNPWSHGGVDRP